jgi:hypothetical protein
MNITIIENGDGSHTIKNRTVYKAANDTPAIKLVQGYVTPGTLYDVTVNADESVITLTRSGVKQ